MSANGEQCELVDGQSVHAAIGRISQFRSDTPDEAAQTAHFSTLVSPSKRRSPTVVALSGRYRTGRAGDRWPRSWPSRIRDATIFFRDRRLPTGTFLAGVVNLTLAAPGPIPISVPSWNQSGVARIGDGCRP